MIFCTLFQLLDLLDLLPIDVVNSPSFAIFKSRLETVNLNNYPHYTN